MSAAERERRKKEALARRGAKKSARSRQGAQTGGGKAGAAAANAQRKKKARPAAGIKASAKLTKKPRGRRQTAAEAGEARALLGQPDQAGAWPAGLLQEQASQQGSSHRGGEAAPLHARVIVTKALSLLSSEEACSEECMRWHACRWGAGAAVAEAGQPAAQGPQEAAHPAAAAGRSAAPSAGHAGAARPAHLHARLL
jgi:hypothetical protein